MRIDSIQIYRSCGAADENHVSPASAGCDTLLLRMTSGPHSGWGEVVVGRSPRQQPEWAGGVVDVVAAWLAPALLGSRIDTPQALFAALSDFAGNPLAKTLLDLAWWDLASREAGLPLWQHLGGQQPSVEVSAYLPIQPTPEQLLAEVGQRVEQGFALVVLEARPGWDLPLVRGVQQAFPSARLALDFRGSFRLEDRELFYRLEDFQLAWLEQPLGSDDLVGHAMLQESLRTPIALSAGIESVQKVRQAADLGSCRMVRIAPSLVGGLTPALAILAECRSAGIGCLLSADGLGPLGRQAALAAGTLAGVTQPAIHMPAWVAEARAEHGQRCELVVSLPGSLVPDLATVQVPAYRVPRRSIGGSLRVELSGGTGLGVDPIPAHGC